MVSKELLDYESCVQRGVVVMQNPDVDELRSNATNPFVQPFKDEQVKLFIDGLSGTHEFPMDNPFVIKKKRLALP